MDGNSGAVGCLALGIKIVHLSDDRISALNYIRSRGKIGASALEVFDIVATPKQKKFASVSQKDLIGLSVACALVKLGLVNATRSNRFVAR